jgi:hypothetical protein
VSENRYRIKTFSCNYIELVSTMRPNLRMTNVSFLQFKLPLTSAQVWCDVSQARIRLQHIHDNLWKKV